MKSVLLPSLLLSPVLASVGALLALPAGAQLQTQPPLQPQPAQRSFDQVKQRRLARLDAMRACVAQSTSFEQMRACKPQRKTGAGVQL